MTERTGRGRVEMSGFSARVVSGRQQAAGFIAMPWVKERLAQLLGFAPFPGTLNLELTEPQARAAWRELSCSGVCLAVAPEEEGFCPASFFPVLVNGEVPGGIVLPHVPGYPEYVVEVVAGESLRERFSLVDGAEVRLAWSVDGGEEVRPAWQPATA